MKNIPIDKIKPYPQNAKKHPVKQIKQIADSITAFGFNQPLVVDQKNVIIVGHGRYEAAKLLGLKEVPVIQAKLSLQKARAYRLADNKLNESDWDQGLLLEELKALTLEGFDISLAGFDKSILDVVEDDFDAQAEYDKITQPEAKLGDLWALGEHRLMCGDSTKLEDVEKLMNGQICQMIFTDPPYNVDYKSSAGNTYKSKKYGGTGREIFNDDKTDEDCLAFYKAVLDNLRLVSSDTTPIYWWFANKNNHINRRAFIESGWYMSQIIIWLKNSMVFSMGQDYHRQYEPCMFGWQKGKTHFRNKKFASFKDVFNLEFDDFQAMLDVWYQHRDPTAKYIHPTQKPVKLAERALRRSSQQGDIVVDLFNGSGSTMMACHQMGRKCYAMELDPKFIDVALLRWEKFTGEHAKKIN